ncbi:phosphotransferase family protein [Phenylobacterium sp. LjRoot219]|uniref:phosphotransferase family protein n=1 Tax=Phenylobacterium sp. LjRoot219 TaxID=3342283 RepID=UPI003ECC7AC8
MSMGYSLAELVDVPRLAEWLDVHVPQLGSGPLAAELIHGGFSNVVISLDRGGPETMVLRRPPTVPPPGSERTVLREARVLAALDGTPAPHPRCYGVCDDDAVIGAPFYVMERVSGWSGKVVDRKVQHQAPFDRMPFEYGIPFAITDALVALANVDYRAVGLGDFGKPDGFLERQVDRWASQLASYKGRYGYAGRDLPGYAEVEGWLRASTPKGFRSGILHGDIGTTNMMFRPDPPVRIVALLDWELSTIGDPLIDLAWFSNGLRDERMPDTPVDSVQGSVHWPSRQEIARYYAAGTGRDMSEFDYYLVLAQFKAGCIMEYKVAQAAAGKLPKDVGEFFSGSSSTVSRTPPHWSA